MARNEKKTDSPRENELKFKKERLLGFQRYAGRLDLLKALLDDSLEYSLAEADSVINKFMKGRVN